MDVPQSLPIYERTPMKHYFATFALATLWALPIQAQETATIDAESLSTTPVVQDADWAKSWWGKRHEEKLAAKEAMEKVDLLWIGDSITHSWENGGKEVWKKYYGDRNAFNIGFSGDRTEHVLWRLENGEVEGIEPKLAIMMIGTNNTGHRKEKPELTAAGIKAILEQLDKRLPETKILLLGVFPRDKSPNGEMRMINEGINAIIKDYADNEQVFYMDIGGLFLDDDGTLPESIMPDALHPNKKGYEIWAEAVEEKIAQLLGES
jgi:beta-glucosidase